MKVYIVDDEPKSLAVLKQLIEGSFSDVHLCGTAMEVNQAFYEISKQDPDLVLLDIELGPESGFDLLKRFRHVSFHVAFVTAHEDYAIRAIKFAALDYLIKPVDLNDLKLLIERVHAHPLTEKRNSRVKYMFKNFVMSDKTGHKLSISTVDGYEFIKVGDVIHIRADKGRCEVSLLNGTKLITSKGLTFFESVLRPYSFYRVHNSTLINLRYVVAYHKKSKGTVKLENGDEFSVAKSRRDEFLRILAVQ